MTVPELVVIGCPSIDLLEVRGASTEAPGGAGFNTALAACAGGLRVGLVAVLPPHVPASIGQAFGPRGLDRGGITVRQGSMPHFHIAYDDDERAHYLAAEPGTESTLTAVDIPDPWLQARHIHVGPLAASSERQLAVAEALRSRGFIGSLSAGSFQADIDTNRAAAEVLLERTDVFFLNRAEMHSLCPDGPPSRPGTHICVTEGRNGVTIYRGPEGRHHEPLHADVVDPTGAGDAFCGGYLAGWLSGHEPVRSGQHASGIALSGYGSTALVAAVAEMVEPRVEVVPERIDSMAAAVGEHAASATLDFCGFPFPDRDQPWALECLAVATLHQYGFWYGGAEGWVEPMFAAAGGDWFKGSDYIWQAYTGAASEDPTTVSLERLATEPGLFAAITRGDNGRSPVPDATTHAQLQVAYARALLQAGHASFGDLLADVAQQDRPGRALLDALAHIPGYREDPLAKKANLLVIMLAGRPEGFLDLCDPESVTPIIDYHLMRSCLRTGCVRIVDPDLRRRIEARAWVDGAEEDEIRRACFDAVNRLVARSGLSQASIDGFFFTNARSHCIETAAPRCDDCPVTRACVRATPLFQPVYRTTAY